MPFPMMHLHIARAMRKTLPDRFDPALFYLGSLAPDSVHFRENYTGDYKLASHVCIDTWKWSESTENETWEAHVLDFFTQKQSTVEPSFLHGYCAHILADIAWNESFWIPFKKSNAIDSTSYLGSGMHQDCYEIDTLLYEQLPGKGEIWRLLDHHPGYEIPGVVSKKETERMIQSLLQEQYAHRAVPEGYAFHHVTLPQVLAFLQTQAERIPGKLNLG